MTFCLLVCQMCGKGTLLQIRSQIKNSIRITSSVALTVNLNVTFMVLL